MVARFLEVDCPAMFSAGNPTPVTVRILNTGLTRWLADTGDSPLGRVRLGISLLDADGRIANLDFCRLPLPHDVEPGGAVTVRGEMPGVAEGRFGLRFDLVAEGVNWFSDKGSRAYLCRDLRSG
jgi:hypothetical protein